MENFNYLEIDKYLNGELTEKELMTFREKLKTDTDFANEVKLYQEIESKLTSKMSNQKEENDLRNTLEDLSLVFSEKEGKTKSEKQKVKKQESKVFSLKRYSKYMVAASIILIATILWKNSINPIYSDFANHESIDLVVRGNSDKNLINAQDAFNSKDFVTAEKELRTLLYLDRTKVELQLYLGICLLEQNKYEKAESIFNKIATGKSIYKNKAIWYMALSKLKQKDYKSCKVYLKQIPKDAEDYQNAKKLFVRL